MTHNWNAGRLRRADGRALGWCEVKAPAAWLREVEQLRAATLDARARTGDDTIGTSSANGRYNVVRVLPRGESGTKVEYLVRGLTLADAVAYLNAMGAE